MKKIRRNLLENTGKEVNEEKRHAQYALFLLCARHGASLAGESPVTGIYHQV